MAQRKRIGLVFSYDEDWIGGSYYILNIIKALKSLPAKEQPTIVVVANDRSHFEIVKSDTAYPFLEYFELPIPKPTYSVLERMMNKTSLLLLKKKVINKKPKLARLDFIYPRYYGSMSEKELSRVNWVPDFQEVHFPELFSVEILEKRKKFQQDVLSKGDVAVFSSLNARKDFDSIFPDSKVKRYVLPFAVVHPRTDKIDIATLKSKYKLPRKYYFSPNQFWAHKNHMVILKAVNDLKLKGCDIKVLFSGKDDGMRHEDYTNKLKQFVSENDMESQVQFLGFIPRDEQLKLMENAIAIVQPSQFEGWSTVVEDAKALGKFIVLSDLDVHREQISEHAHFFDQKGHTELGEILLKYWENPPPARDVNYAVNIDQFARSFMKLVESVS